MVVFNARLTALKWPVGVSRLSRLKISLGSYEAVLCVNLEFRRFWEPRPTATTPLNSLFWPKPFVGLISSFFAVRVFVSLLIPNTRLVSRLVFSTPKFQMSAHHVFSHAGNAGNECADGAPSLGMRGFISKNNYSLSFAPRQVFKCNALLRCLKLQRFFILSLFNLSWCIFCSLQLFFTCVHPLFSFLSLSCDAHPSCCSKQRRKINCGGKKTESGRVGEVGVLLRRPSRQFLSASAPSVTTCSQNTSHGTLSRTHFTLVHTHSRAPGVTGPLSKMFAKCNMAFLENQTGFHQQQSMNPLHINTIHTEISDTLTNRQKLLRVIFDNIEHKQPSRLTPSITGTTSRQFFKSANVDLRESSNKG